ncbi:MAG: c-type cytochrome [Paracoccaceae bacterium]
MRRALLGLVCGLVAVPAAAGGYLTLEGHGGPIRGVAVSPDGRQAATASFDTSLGLWATSDGRHAGWAEGHEAGANAVVFLPDGRLLSAGDDFAAILWDATGRLLRRLEGHRGKIVGVATTGDGRRAATASWDGDIGLWDLETGVRVGWLDGHRANVNDVAFSEDGQRLYSASYDGTIRVWDVAEMREIRTLVSHGFGVNRLVLNEAAGWLAYGGVDGAIRVVGIADGAPRADLSADRRPILALALSADGDRLAVGDGQGYISVVETAGWTFIRDFRAAKHGPIWALAFAGDRLLAGGIADEAVFWPLGGGTATLFAEARGFQTPPDEMANGERQFVRKCSICHSVTPDGARKAGPTLWKLFGRPAGAVAGYRYSDALAGSTIVWTDESVDALFRLGPDRVTPGSKMPVQKIARPEDRADLIAYLRRTTTGEPDSDRSARP